MREGHPQRQPCSEGNGGTGFLKRGETDTTGRRTQSGGNHTKKGMDTGLHGLRLGLSGSRAGINKHVQKKVRLEMAALREGLLRVTATMTDCAALQGHSSHSSPPWASLGKATLPSLSSQGHV